MTVAFLLWLLVVLGFGLTMGFLIGRSFQYEAAYDEARGDIEDAWDARS